MEEREYRRTMCIRTKVGSPGDMSRSVPRNPVSVVVVGSWCISAMTLIEYSPNLNQIITFLPYLITLTCSIIARIIDKSLLLRKIV